MNISDFTYTPEDVRYYQQWFLKHNRIILLMKRLLAFLFGALFVIGLFLWLNGGRHGVVYIFLSIFLPLLSKLIYSTFMLLFLKSKQMVTALNVPHSFLIDDTGVTSTRGTESVHTGWSGYVSIEETPQLFILRKSFPRAKIIPKRVMSISQIEDLRILIQKYSANHMR